MKYVSSETCKYSPLILGKLYLVTSQPFNVWQLGRISKYKTDVHQCRIAAKFNLQFRVERWHQHNKQSTNEIIYLLWGGLGFKYIIRPESLASIAMRIIKSHSRLENAKNQNKFSCQLSDLASQQVIIWFWSHHLVLDKWMQLKTYGT